MPFSLCISTCMFPFNQFEPRRKSSASSVVTPRFKVNMLADVKLSRRKFSDSSRKISNASDMMRSPPGATSLMSSLTRRRNGAFDIEDRVSPRICFLISRTAIVPDLHRRFLPCLSPSFTAPAFSISCCACSLPLVWCAVFFTRVMFFAVS